MSASQKFKVLFMLLWDSLPFVGFLVGFMALRRYLDGKVDAPGAVFLFAFAFFAFASGTELFRWTWAAKLMRYHRDLDSDPSDTVQVPRRVLAELVGCEYTQAVGLRSRDGSLIVSHYIAEAAGEAVPTVADLVFCPSCRGVDGHWRPCARERALAIGRDVLARTRR